MDDLARTIAFLESLGLAHGDLRPEDILLDRDRLKISDFDWAATIGTSSEGSTGMFGRLLNDRDHGEWGTFGDLGPRTEQFALGSLYYYINHGFEVYEDRPISDNPSGHGCEARKLLQEMRFPGLHGDPAIDDIIHKYWHFQYPTVSDLAGHTNTLLAEHTNVLLVGGTDLITNHARVREHAAGVDGGMGTSWLGSIFRWHAVFLNHLLRRPFSRLSWWTAIVSRNGKQTRVIERTQTSFPSDDDPKKRFCQELEKRGLLDHLSSAEPQQLGFGFEGYRHTK